MCSTGSVDGREVAPRLPEIPDDRAAKDDDYEPDADDEHGDPVGQRDVHEQVANTSAEPGAEGRGESWRRGRPTCPFWRRKAPENGEDVRRKGVMEGEAHAR